MLIKDNDEKFNIVLDYQKFNNQCHEVKIILAKHECMVFESKSKFRHLTLKNSKKQKIIKQLSSCLSNTYYGFHIVFVEYSKKLREKFKPIDII